MLNVLRIDVVCTLVIMRHKERHDSQYIILFPASSPKSVMAASFLHAVWCVGDKMIHCRQAYKKNIFSISSLYNVAIKSLPWPGMLERFQHVAPFLAVQIRNLVLQELER